MTSVIFHQKLANFAISKNTDIIAFRYIIFNFLNIFWVFKDVLINMVTIWLKMATLGLLKIKLFLNKDYDIIVSVHDVINNILSRDSYNLVDVVMWPNFGNNNFNERSYHNINFMRIWPDMSLFFGSFCFKVNYLGLALGMALKSHASVAKGLKLKVRKCWGLIPTFSQICEFKFAVT